MANAAIKIGTVGPNPQHQNNDYLQGFNDRCIQQCYAEHLCFHTRPNPDSNGISTNPLICEEFFRVAYLYRFEYVSRFKVRRINQKTGATIIIEDGTDIDDWLFNRKAHLFEKDEFGNLVNNTGKHIFGPPGFERWYGKTKDFSVTGILNIWNMLESKTPERKDDSKYKTWPFGLDDLKWHLCIPCNDFTDVVSDQYVESKTQIVPHSNPAMAAFGETQLNTLVLRTKFIGWITLEGVTANLIPKIQDPSLPIDFLKSADYDIPSLIQTKI